MPPAILLRFLREHRSEWADSSIEAYSAAAIKASPCNMPGTRIGGFGSQVILPLAHTIEHEEASKICFVSCHWWPMLLLSSNKIANILRSIVLTVYGGC